MDIGAEKQFSYDDAASTTNRKLNRPKAKIRFGSGSLAGHFHSDDLRLGSCDGPKGQVLIKQQEFGSVEEQKTIFKGNNYEAIIGLAYPTLAKEGVKPVFDQMMVQKLL